MHAATPVHHVRRSLRRAVLASALLVPLAAPAVAQKPAKRPAKTPAARPAPEPAPAPHLDPTVPAPEAGPDSAAAVEPFVCAPGGLADGAEFGCKLIARPTVTRFPAGPVYWHLARYASREQALVDGRFTDYITEAGDEVWLHRFGVEGDVPRGGLQTATVGPLAIPKLPVYEIDVFYVVMPAGARTPVETRPGPAAWFVLDGAQCVETSRGVVQAETGEGAVAPRAGTPMQWVNTGAGAERALFVLVRDPGRHLAAPSRWKPKGACDAPPG